MIGYIDLENDVLREYAVAVEKKRGVCEILPKGRFYITNGGVRYAGLVCSEKMGGRNTGVGAEGCQNCAITPKEES